MATTNEARWIDQARQGDRNAFAELVRTHQGSVRALLRRLTGGQWALADDLAQETFLRAWQGLPRFRSEAGFGTWLYRIAYNTYLMQVRRTKGTSETYAASLDEDESQVTSSMPSLDAVAHGEVQRALLLLSPAERVAIIQCYYLGLSHAEAAIVLDCPLGTVKSHLRRALGKLRDHLGTSMNKRASDEPSEQPLRA
ncbi:MAG: sigma-70 family RNA polymerase sigma factor [Acidimicrobiales bacterium]